MTNRQDRQISMLGIFVSAGMIGLMAVMVQMGRPDFGNSGSISGAIEALAPTGAGQASSAAPPAAAPQRTETYLPGSVAAGRVADVYIKVADNVFLLVDQAPEHLATWSRSSSRTGTTRSIFR
jgi:hypothetical protein